MRIFTALMLPILLCGADSRTIFHSDAQKLETFQMQCLRRVLGITLQGLVQNEDIRRRCCDQPPAAAEIRKRWLKGFGHLCRMEPSRLPHELSWRVRPTGWKIQRNAS
ncbi:hypothetical protein Y032_0112g333 [Ancylostoma ceylanicum]|uniref:Secreted protein n=1 Tax=Ancylostoma ceylanicum TaxID=53326 RepID=A0A016TE01_9BILA|nr:hypothetical protein Y032_0112g333 [Ancylostoma ceylanicum]